MSDSKTWSIDRVLNKTHFHGKHMKKMCTKQGFPQVLRTWRGVEGWRGGGGGAPQNLMGGGGEGVALVKTWGELKMLLAISLQAQNLLLNELLHTYFSRILARF